MGWGLTCTCAGRRKMAKAGSSSMGYQPLFLMQHIDWTIS